MVGGSRPSAPAEFDFDLKLFRLSAVKKAAYRFTDAYILEFEQLSDSLIRVRLVPRDLGKPARCDSATLPNEVLDQELREVVAEETKSVRDLLLAQTYSGLPLVDPVGESADYHDDPLGIGKKQRLSAADGGA